MCRFLRLAFAILILSMADLSAIAAGRDSKRAKVIDFEDEVVEGLNRRPLDSLSQISERDRKRKKPHLYRKRASFKSETRESLRTARFTP
ncbi:MAG: hypothetical protein NDJ89_10630 [Oligoflexia bacterium]|nr:hypothetical protein [Oligoflexia bacterium]